MVGAFWLAPLACLLDRQAAASGKGGSKALGDAVQRRMQL